MEMHHLIMYTTCTLRTAHLILYEVYAPKYDV